MRSSTGSTFAAIFVMLFGFLQFGLADTPTGNANVAHWCTYDVWCAVVEGYNVTTPQSQRAGVTWEKQLPGVNITTYFNAYPSNTGIAMMCTRDPTASTPLVTQLEYTCEEDQGLTYFDVSNVAGVPFVNDGFKLDVYDAKDPKLQQNNCHTAYCAAGDANCNQAYEKSDDDLQAMRACFDDVILSLTLCTH